MYSWLLRGLIMTAVHVIARVLLGMAVIGQPLQSTSWRTIAIAAVVLIALVWGGFDGISDARANPDPDDYGDLTIRWLRAGVLAGVLAGVISWLLGTFAMAGIGQSGLLIEIFAGGSFTALIVFFPSFIGAAIGRWLVRRDQNKAEKPSRSSEQDDSGHHDFGHHDEIGSEQTETAGQIRS